MAGNENANIADIAKDANRQLPLFTAENGEEMRFYMTIGAEKARITRLVAENGGKMERIHNVNDCKVGKVVTLVADNVVYREKDDGYDIYRMAFVVDSVKRGELMDLKEYRVNAKNKNDGNNNGNDNSNRKKKFTPEEDEKIIAAVRKICGLQNNNAALSVNGVLLWRMLEEKKIVDHSWQSMKNRYVKTLLPMITQRNQLINNRTQYINISNNNHNNSNDSINNNNSKTQDNENDEREIKRCKQLIEELSSSTGEHINVIVHALYVNDGKRRQTLKYLLQS